MYFRASHPARRATVRNAPQLGLSQCCGLSTAADSGYARNYARMVQGVITRKRDGVKILGMGELKVKLAFEVFGASKAAQARLGSGRFMGAA